MKKIFVIAFASLMAINVTAQTSQPNVVAKPQIKTQQQVKPKGKRPGVTPEQRIQKKVELLQSQLGLNPEQAKKLTVAMTTRNEALKLVKEKTGENRDAYKTEAMPIRKKFQADLKSILTPEQFAKLREMRKANRRANPNEAPAKNEAENDLIDETEPYLQKNN